MTAKNAQMSTMILLVVPLGFSTGTELLNTKAQSSQIDFPMVNFDPPAPAKHHGMASVPSTTGTDASQLCKPQGLVGSGRVGYRGALTPALLVLLGPAPQPLCPCLGSPQPC